jgi:hypothetical protein
MPTLRRSFWALTCTIVGCTATPSVKTTGARTSVYADGRDASERSGADRERSALEQLLSAPLGVRHDPERTLEIPVLDDGSAWRFTRLQRLPARATFRYRRDDHAAESVYYTASRGPATPARCLQQLLHDTGEARALIDLSWSMTRVRSLPRRIEPHRAVDRIVVHELDAEVRGLVESRRYKAAIAVYPHGNAMCLARSFAVVAERHPELAERVRERWVSSAAPGLVWEREHIAPPDRGDGRPPFLLDSFSRARP